MEKSFFLKFNLIWLISSVLLVSLLYFFLYSNVPKFPFLSQNLIFLGIFLLNTRLILFLQYSFIKHKRLLLKGLIFLSLGIFFYLATKLFEFKEYFDDYLIFDYVVHSEYSERLKIGKLVLNQYIFIASSAIISSLFLPFKIVSYLWKTSKETRDNKLSS